MSGNGRPGNHALVIGGSIAGLLAARVLSDHFGRVTLVERDAFPEGPETRQGTPQARHAHALLARGEQVLSRLFPGIAAELLAAGGCCGDMGEILRWYQFGGYKRRHTSGLSDYTQTRPFLEWHVRRRLRAIENVELIGEAPVSRLLHDGARVSGAEVRHRGVTRAIPAELTVDCGGRGSRAPRLLEEMGFPSPPVTEIPIHVGYATCIFRRDPTERQVTLIFPKPPGDKRGAAIMPVEGDRWICTLGGWAGDHPPTDLEGFRAFARSLAAPDAFDLISRCDPLSEPVPHKFPANLRRHYERLRGFPSGYLVMGDAICSFNPLYGQGMTSSAIQAEVLDASLREGLAPGWAQRHFRAVARAIQAPWEMAVSEDLRYAEVPGRRSLKVRFGHRYLNLVHRAVTQDTAVYGTFLRVLNLMEPPEALMRPAIAARVMRAALTHSAS